MQNVSEESDPNVFGANFGPNEILGKCPECGQNEKFMVVRVKHAENHYEFKASCCCGFVPDDVLERAMSYDDKFEHSIVMNAVSFWDYAVKGFGKDKAPTKYPFENKTPRREVYPQKEIITTILDDIAQVDHLFKHGAEMTSESVMAALLSVFKEARRVAHLADYMKAEFAYGKFKVIQTDPFFEGPLNLPVLMPRFVAENADEEVGHIFGPGMAYNGNMSVFWKNPGQRELINELAHAFLGLISEVGELMDATLVPALRGQPMDRNNAMEEDGDLLFYQQCIRSVNGFSIIDSLSKRIEKLKKRYPEGYSDKAGSERADKQEGEK